MKGMCVNGLTVLAALVLLTLPSMAEEGTFMVVKGDIKVESAKDKKISPARVGMKVSQGDAIIAGKEARAKIVMQDKNIMNISPDSKLVIEKYEFKGEADKKNVTLNLVYGKVRTTVNQKYDGENKFRIKTPSAVAGVRGTDFLTSYNKTTDASKLVTFTGKVEFGSKMDGAGNIVSAVMVTPGQFSVATSNMPPAPPMSIPKQEMASIEKDSGDKPQSKENDGGRAPASDGKGGPPGEGNKDGKDGDGKGGGSGMFRPEDTKDGGNDPSKGPPMMAGPPGMFLPPPIPGQGLIPDTQFIDPELLRQNSTKLIINVQYQ